MNTASAVQSTATPGLPPNTAPRANPIPSVVLTIATAGACPRSPMRMLHAGRCWSCACSQVVTLRRWARTTIVATDSMKAPMTRLRSRRSSLVAAR